MYFMRMTMFFSIYLTISIVHILESLFYVLVKIYQFTLNFQCSGFPFNREGSHIYVCGDVAGGVERGGHAAQLKQNIRANYKEFQKVYSPCLC